MLVTYIVVLVMHGHTNIKLIILCLISVFTHSKEHRATEMCGLTTSLLSPLNSRLKIRWIDFKQAYVRGYKTLKKFSTDLNLYIPYFRDSVLSKKSIAILAFYGRVNCLGCNMFIST